VSLVCHKTRVGSQRAKLALTIWDWLVELLKARSRLEHVRAEKRSLEALADLWTDAGARLPKTAAEAGVMSTDSQ
jgi:hypothetical protein